MRRDDRPGLFGRRLGRREATARRLMPATPPDVWRVISDVERIEQWWPRALGGLVVSGEDDGREQIVRLQWGSREGVVRQRVNRWEPGVRYGWRVLAESAGDKTLAPIAETNVTISVRHEGGQAAVEIVGVFEPVGARGGLAVRQLVKLARKSYVQALRNLDQLLVQQRG